MKILVLGAGAVGGYFGGRLVQAGADVTFLVRKGRRDTLARHGLKICSALGDFRAKVKTVTRDELAAPWDVILLTCKAYDLESAIEAIRPAVGPHTAIVPLLNGIAHMGRLNDAFGTERVLGGVAKIIVAAEADGSISHLNDWCNITFGEQSGELSERVRALQAAFPTRSVSAAVAPAILHVMWEKIVHLASVAIVTTLLRASVGEIARVEGGTELFNRVFDTNVKIAACEGYPVTPAFLAEYRRLFANQASPYVPSLLRDLEKHGEIEGGHIVGFMLARAQAHGLDASVHHLAWLNLKVYEIRRADGRF